MFNLIKGVITSRNTIIEETQGPSDNNINNISSYQEKTILTLDNGSQYSTHLKVDAQCGDKIALLSNSVTHDIKAVFDTNNHYLYQHEKSEKGSPALLGLLSFSITFGFTSLMSAMITNHNISNNIGVSIGVLLIISLIASLLFGFFVEFAVNNHNSKIEKEEDKSLNIQMELKDFFDGPTKCEYVIDREILKI